MVILISCMEQEVIDSLTFKLKQFKKESDMAFNYPIRMKNGITIMLSHWKPKDENLTVSICLPEESVKPDEDEKLSNTPDRYSKVAEKVKQVIVDCGYNEPEPFRLADKRENIVTERYRYIYESTVTNPILTK